MKYLIITAMYFIISGCSPIEPERDPEPRIIADTICTLSSDPKQYCIVTVYKEYDMGAYGKMKTKDSIKVIPKP